MPNAFQVTAVGRDAIGQSHLTERVDEAVVAVARCPLHVPRSAIHADDALKTTVETQSLLVVVAIGMLRVWCETRFSAFLPVEIRARRRNETECIALIAIGRKVHDCGFIYPPYCVIDELDAQIERAERDLRVLRAAGSPSVRSRSAPPAAGRAAAGAPASRPVPGRWCDPLYPAALPYYHDADIPAVARDDVREFVHTLDRRGLFVHRCCQSAGHIRSVGHNARPLLPRILYRNNAFWVTCPFVTYPPCDAPCAIDDCCCR